MVIYNARMIDTVLMPEFESFEWDQANIEKNWLTHKVTPCEAEEVFFNKPLLVADDPMHSTREKRYYVLGQTNQGRMLLAVFTLRKKRVRVISARDMSRKERKIYTRL